MYGEGAQGGSSASPMDPIHGTPATTQEWYDRASPLYARFVEDLEFPPTRRAIDALDLGGEEIVLDLGCGAGRAVAAIGTHLDAGGHVVGVDFAPGMCRETLNTIDDSRASESASVVCGDVTDLPIATDSVDVALSSFVLDLLTPTDIDAALNEMRRVLVPDGRVAIVSLAATGSVPTRAYRTLRRLFPTQMDCRPIPLRSILETGGFEIEWETQRSLYGLPVTVAIAET